MTSPLWMPDKERIDNTQISRFIRFVNEHRRASVAPDYFSLHAWAVANPEDFWSAVWDFCEVVAAARGADVLLDAHKLPGARWFPQARLNFAENLLRYRDERPALVSLLENGTRRQFSYAQLCVQVAALASSLRTEGVVAGDRVVGFLPNVAEAVIAMLATASIGAVWSSCSPDFGIDGVVDRFGQIEPKVLFAADGYFYNGKTCDSLQRLAEIVQQIGSIEKVVVVPLLNLRSYRYYYYNSDDHLVSIMYHCCCCYY